MAESQRLCQGRQTRGRVRDLCHERCGKAGGAALAPKLALCGSGGPVTGQALDVGELPATVPLVVRGRLIKVSLCLISQSPGFGEIAFERRKSCL